MGALSIYHWVVVLLVILLVFGPKRIASLGEGLGEAVRGLKNGLRDEAPGSEGSLDK